MEFCGDYYDTYENKRIFISNASWEILNRTFFTRILKSSQYCEQLVEQAPLSKVIALFDVLYNWKTIFWIKHVNFKLP